MSEDRDAATGQFMASSEPLVGREGVEADAGFKQMDESPKREKDTDFANAREAADALAASRNGVDPDPVTEVFYQNVATGERIDGAEGNPVRVVTPERAAADLSAYHGDKMQSAALSISAEFAAQVDKMRGDVLKAKPELAEHYGIEPEDGKEGEKTEAKREAKKSAEPADHQTLNDDVDPELVETIRKHPQVRELIAQEVTETHQVREAYSAGLENTRVHALSTLAEVVPHLAGLPPAQFVEGLDVLRQVDPPAFEKTMNILGRVHQITQAQEQEKQQRAHAQQQQFEAQRQRYSKACDEALGPMTATQKAEQVEGLVNYVGEFGVTREQLAHEAKTNLALHHPAFQQLALDALKYRSIMKLGKPAKTVPQVQRPGTRSNGEGVSAKIQSLEAKLDNASGLKAARIAAELTAARRAARGG